MKLCVHAAIGLADQASKPPLFDTQTSRGEAYLEVRGVDHHTLIFAMFSSQTRHHLGEDAFIATPLPAVV